MIQSGIAVNKRGKRERGSGGETMPHNVPWAAVMSSLASSFSPTSCGASSFVSSKYVLSGPSSDKWYENKRLIGYKLTQKGGSLHVHAWKIALSLLLPDYMRTNYFPPPLRSAPNPPPDVPSSTLSRLLPMECSRPMVPHALPIVCFM